VDAVQGVVQVAGAIPGFCQPVSSLSHLTAAGVALVAAIPLVRLGRRSPRHALVLSVYAFCVVATLAISGIYHALSPHGSARLLMQRLDYLAIWLVIAGTFTAVHGVMFSGFWRVGVLAIIWGYALIASLLQVCWFATFSGVVGLVLYLGLGWIGLATVIKLGREIGARTVRPFWFAGLAFSAGAVLEASGHPVLVVNWIGPHEIFHLAVIAGLALHWLFIRKLVVVHAPPECSSPAPPALASTSEGNRFGSTLEPRHA
jgi:channel protein (hemolysin III family)